MGDRVVMQVVSRDRRHCSPAVYGHWGGNHAPEIVRALRKRMESRGEDVDYTAARLVQEMTSGDPNGNLSFGMWNASEPLTANDSHGDAGCVLITWDINGRMIAECFGGYLCATADGDVLLSADTDAETPPG